MKYVKLYENFKLVDLGNHNWYGTKPDSEYVDQVRSFCMDIAMQESETSEKAFQRMDNLKVIIDKALNERNQEFDAIVHNCKNRNMRPQFCAETVYHAVLQGKINALLERPSMMGGLGD